MAILTIFAVDAQTMFASTVNYESNDVYGTSYTYKTVNGNNYNHSIRPNISNRSFQTDFVVTNPVVPVSLTYDQQYDTHSDRMERSLIEMANKPKVSTTTDIYGNDEELIKSSTNSIQMQWTTDVSGKILYAEELDRRGKLVLGVEYDIIGFIDDDTAINIYVEDDEGTRVIVTFFKEGLLVSYTYSDSYTLFTGNITY